MKSRSLRDCNGCEAAIALKLGADQSFVGVVRRISRTEYTLRFQIRDAHTGALVIARQSDLRIGAANARFGVPIGRTLGNCLSMPNYLRLAVLLGPARVKDIIFTARLIDAGEAHAIGLLSEVLPDYAALQTRTAELARTVASQAPLTLRVTKEALRRIKEKMTPEEDRDLILMCYMSRDFREGMDAFLNKRAPKWTGR